jgi:hypothetical protein
MVSRPDRAHGGRASGSPTQAMLDLARMTDNELVLFDHERRESWIIYPPRSQYDFLKRPSPETVLVEHHPWAPFSTIVEHAIVAREGCTEHQLDCGAQRAIQAGLDIGWNPFR